MHRLENKKKKSQNKSKQRHLIPQVSTNGQPSEAMKADRNNPIPNATEKWNELLRVQVRLTNAEREMKRIFNVRITPNSMHLSSFILTDESRKGDKQKNRKQSIS